MRRVTAFLPPKRRALFIPIPSARQRRIMQDVPLRILSVFAFNGARASRGEHFARHWAQSLDEPRRLAIVTNLGSNRLAPGRIVSGELVAVERSGRDWIAVYSVTI